MKGIDRSAGRIPSNPKPSDLVNILPCGLDPIKIEALPKPISSDAIIDQVQKLGMSYSELGLHLFKDSKFGKTRALNNEDMITGYPQYGTGQEGVNNLSQVMSDAKSFRDDFYAALQPHEVLHDMEDEDLKKISILRPVLLGRHLQPPISLDFKHIRLPEDFKSLLKKVIRRYASSSAYTKTGRAAIYEGTDAKETALGSPSFYVGEQYHAARLATMECMPVPDYSKPSIQYIADLERFGGMFLPDPSIIYASYLSYRQGATNKPAPLFTHNGFGYSATHQAYSLYTRQRAVWAAPFYLNVLLTPLVLRMKSSRQHILGMWHDPQSEAKYIPKLQAQGKTSIEVDYSSYDSTISNELMHTVYSELAAIGYSPWESSLMAQLTLQQGAITPSFQGTTESVSYFQGQVTLMSGLLTTSELGSIISITIILYCISKQHPHIVEEWLSGKFIILVQSDDVLFTTDLKFDLDEFSSTAAKLGITAKIKFGSTFLKRFLPVGTITKLAKPMSRNLQQTIGNEDTYDGKPDAILRLGLAARTTGLNGHPLFSKFFPRLFEIYESHFDYVRSISTKKEWLRGECSLNDGDVRAIQQYAESAAGNGLLTNLLERAAFDPSAAIVVNYLKARGLDISFLAADQVAARRAYTDALFTSAKSDSLTQLMSFARWNS